MTQSKLQEYISGYLSFFNDDDNITFDIEPKNGFFQVCVYNLAEHKSVTVDIVLEEGYFKIRDSLIYPLSESSFFKVLFCNLFVV